MTTVNKYEIYCNTEAAWVSDWSETEITKCPNDDTHNVNPDSVRIINSISNQEFEIKQEDVKTGKRIRISNVSFNVDAGQTVTHDHTFPINISLMGGFTKTIETQKDDIVSIHVAPDTVIGSITSNSELNTTSIIVNSTVIDSIFVGGFINLTDGTNVSNNSQVVDINTDTNTLTLDTPLDRAFTSGDSVRLTVVAVDNVIVGHAGSRTFGTHSLVGRYIPANTIIRFIYTNNYSSSYTPSIQFEYFY